MTGATALSSQSMTTTQELSNSSAEMLKTFPETRTWRYAFSGPLSSESPMSHGSGTGAFPDAHSVIPAVVRLAKGELSGLIPTGIPGRGVVAYVEDRQPGQDAAAARAQFKAGIQRERDNQGGLFVMSRMMQPQVQAWCDANLARFNVQPSDWASMRDSADEGDSDDGEGSQD